MANKSKTNATTSTTLVAPIKQKFTAILENADTIKATFEAISFLISETFMIGSPGGLTIQAADPSHAALLLAHFTPDVFDEYQCPDEGFKFGLNITDVIKILRRAKKSDKIHMSLETENTIHVRFKSEKSTRTFKLKSKKIKDINEQGENMVENLSIQLQERFNASIKIESDLLDDIVKDAVIISDLVHVRIGTDNLMTFRAENETGEVEVEIDLEDSKCVLYSDVEANCEAGYALDYLENILKIKSVVSIFELSLGVDIPIKITGVLMKEGNPTQGSITYILAPRVEDEEDDEYSDDVEDISFDDSIVDDLDSDIDETEGDD